MNRIITTSSLDHYVITACILVTGIPACSFSESDHLTRFTDRSRLFRLLQSLRVTD